jgi:tetratricopeptide (TPR) repeat protein
VIPVAEPMFAADKNNVKLVRYLATAYASEKKSDKTVEYYTLLEKTDSLKSDDYRYWGFAYNDLKKDTLAAMMWEKSIALDSNQSALYGNAGSIWMSNKRWARAAELFRNRARIDTSATGAYINLALCLMAMERFDEATVVLEKVIRQNPNYPPAYVKLGQCYNLQNRFDDARKMFESAVKVIDTAESRYRNDLLELNKGLAIGQMLDKSVEGPKKWESSIGYLLKALKYKDDDVQVNLLLGQAYQNGQKKSDAIKFYKKVLKIDPKNEQARKGLDVLDPK